MCLVESIFVSVCAVENQGKQDTSTRTLTPHAHCQAFFYTRKLCRDSEFYPCELPHTSLGTSAKVDISSFSLFVLFLFHQFSLLSYLLCHNTVILLYSLLIIKTAGKCMYCIKELHQVRIILFQIIYGPAPNQVPGQRECISPLMAT